MPDGSSGLSLSEMGISVKKTGQAVGKAAGSVGQQVKQQFGGSWVPQAPRAQNNPTAKPPSLAWQQSSSAGPPNKGIPMVPGGVFDIAALVKGGKTQNSGGNVSGGTLFQSPSAAQPPNEFSPKKSAGLSQWNTKPGAGLYPAKQPGGFDTSSMFGETNSIGTMKPKQQYQSQQDPQLVAQVEKQKQEDQQKVEALRKKLHDMYFEEFNRKAEGKDKTKEEYEKKKMGLDEEEKRKKEEKEAIMQETPMLSQSSKKGFLGFKKVKTSILNTLRPKTGSHEGRAGKG